MIDVWGSVAPSHGQLTPIVLLVDLIIDHKQLCNEEKELRNRENLRSTYRGERLKVLRPFSKTGNTYKKNK